MKKLNFLLIGLGQMGKIHQRVLNENSNTNLVVIVDSSFSKEHENIDGVDHFNKIDNVDFDKNDIDAVIISTTTDTHYEIAKKLINKNVPLLIEKPLSTSDFEVERILNDAKQKNVIIRCGLIETYNPIFDYLKKLELNNVTSINVS